MVSSVPLQQNNNGYTVVGAPIVILLQKKYVGVFGGAFAHGEVITVIKKANSP